MIIYKIAQFWEECKYLYLYPLGLVGIEISQFPSKFRFYYVISSYGNTLIPIKNRGNVLECSYKLG